MIYHTDLEQCCPSHTISLNGEGHVEDISIICGDSVEVMAGMEDESVDLIITDPPYNVGMDFGNDSDEQDFDSYMEFTRKWLKQACRILSDDGGTIYIFMGRKFISYLYNILEQEEELEFNSWITWHKTQGPGSPNNFSKRHEDILMFNKGFIHQLNMDDIRIPQATWQKNLNMRGANPGDVWPVPQVGGSNANRQGHPSQKPEALIERMVLGSSRYRGVVFDPFSGSGTTLRVCQQLGRQCTGVELNPEYVEATEKRLAAEFTGFDTIDERMTRMPTNFTPQEARDKYIKRHVGWFLKDHPKAIKKFAQNAKSQYGNIPDILPMEE